MKTHHKRSINAAHGAWQDLGFEYHTQYETLQKYKFFPQRTLENLGEIALDVLRERVRLTTLPNDPMQPGPKDDYGFLFLLNK
jgi:hypothetical protein